MATAPADHVVVVPHPEGIRRITAEGAPLMMEITLPVLPLIGPTCRHAQPFTRKEYAKAPGKCPLCRQDLPPRAVAIDGITLALRRILFTHEVPDRVIVTDDGMWSPVTGTDIFPLSGLVTDDDALHWLSTVMFDQLRELPGVDFATACAIAEASPIEGTVAGVARRFMGPFTEQFRTAFMTAVRGNKLSMWHTPEPPKGSETTALIHRTYDAGTKHFTPQTTGILAAIAVRLFENCGPQATARFVHAIHSGDTVALAALYRRTWPSTADSIDHHFTYIEPHLRDMAVYENVFGAPCMSLD